MNPTTFEIQNFCFQKHTKMMMMMFMIMIIMVRNHLPEGTSVSTSEIFLPSSSIEVAALGFWVEESQNKFIIGR